MKKPLLAAMAACIASAAPLSAHSSGITVYQDGDKYVKIGGRIQFQYHQFDPDIGDSSDEVLFRRLRPYLEGSLHKDWKGKIQFDLGKAEEGNEVAVKDAYMQYKGFSNMKVTVGNANFPFSREFLTSSKYQQLVERTFVGDHDYGTPDRNAGIHLTGHSEDKHIGWAASVAQASIDPDAAKLDFDTPVNRNDDFNEGFIVGGRVDFHPMGPLKFSQGDFDGATKATISLAAFTWSNDDDNNTYTTAGTSTSTSKADVDSVTGVELSGAFRSNGISIDIETNKFDADSVDTAFTGGLYRNGSTSLKNSAIEAGVMLPGNTTELVLAYQTQDADNYATAWNRTSAGVNWFLQKHDIKVQLSYRMGENLKGVNGVDADEIFLQSQYVF
ncbi:MAG: porin [Gammaproteobacteria bacterium]